jgi:hypothetical protein
MTTATISVTDEQAKIAAAVRRIVTPRFVACHAALFDGRGTAADRATAMILPLLLDFRAGLIPEAMRAHKALVKQLREDLLDGIANHNHFKLIELLYAYLKASGFTFYYESQQWENHRVTP